MAFSYHPELAPVLAQLADLALPRAARGDWQSLRTYGEAGLQGQSDRLPARDDVARTDDDVTSFDGALIGVRWYEPAERTAPGGAAVYVHGGGMIMGSVAAYDKILAAYAGDSGVPLLAVDYRTAPEHPHPTPIEDTLAALVWLRRNAARFDIDPERIGIIGDSGGGGVAAGTALLARDRGVPLAAQILIYPMLDDRNTEPDPLLEPFAGWSYDDNYTGWRALLGDALGTDAVPGTAAPARAAELSGLPRTYIDVGELDIFRDESIEYARRLTAAGVTTELHVHPGCPHGFEHVNPASGVARRAREDRLRALREI